MKNKLAMFDLDGTLFDTRKLNYLAYKSALKEFGFSLDKEYFYTVCNGRHYKDFLPEIMKGDISHIEEIHAAKKRFYAEYLGEARENTHLFNIIESIKESYHTAVVTTASRKNCEEILSRFDRLDLFELIIAGEDVKNKKPKPDGFLKAMEHFNIKAEDCLIFEDSEVGILAAKESGANVFVVKGYS